MMIGVLICFEIKRWLRIATNVPALLKAWYAALCQPMLKLN
jgi:hypothetical protein